MGVTDTQSYSWVIREVFLDTVSKLPFFSGFQLRRNRRLPIMTDDLPVLGVYIIDETMTPEGEPNAGEIRFEHLTRIGFSVVIKNNDDALSEQTLDAAFWAIMNGLWRDESVTNRRNTKTYHKPLGTPDNVRFESVMRGTRRHVWGASGQNQETDTAEMQYEAQIKYRTEFGVPVIDDLDEIVVKTNFPSDHSGNPADVQQVVIEYDFTQNRGASDGSGQATSASATGQQPTRRIAQGEVGENPQGERDPFRERRANE